MIPVNLLIETEQIGQNIYKLKVNINFQSNKNIYNIFKKNVNRINYLRIVNQSFIYFLFCF